MQIRSVLVTRPREQAGELSSLLTDHGFQSVELPLIRIEEPESWESFDLAFSSDKEYDWLIFASVNAVRSTLRRLELIGRQDKLRVSRLAAIGKTTAAELTSHQLNATYCPPNFIAESFIENFPGYPYLADKKILWPKTNIGRTLIADKLRDAGADVEIIYAYRTCGPENPPEYAQKLTELLRDEKLDVITLTSSETVKQLHSLLQNMEPQKLEQLLQKTQIAVIGPETAQSAKRLLGRVDIQAETFTIDGLVKAIMKQTT
ncbi:MAG: uroporphyrinogen-III synthase [Candidatus Obscuribacterales bacterium]|nr:uroporphyrinogen-III synthase [Candidatus Obscuribacterales bacterium]